MVSPAFLIAGASRPYRGEQANGDAWTVNWHDSTGRIAVVDGLGHGAAAAAAALAATAALAGRPDLPPDAALRLCHQALAGTRGAAIFVGQIDPPAGQLVFAGAGNVQGRLVQAGREQRLVTQRGILGAVLPTLRPVTIPLAREWLLVLHTDGISGRFVLDTGQAMLLDLQTLADALLSEWGRAHDDATVVVARSASHDEPVRL